MEIILPLSVSGSTKRLRYQPIPPRKAPPPTPLGPAESKGNSMLQSCGKVTVRQAASSMATALYPFAASSLNFQLLLKFIFLVDRNWAAAIPPQRKAITINIVLVLVCIER